MGFRAKVLTVSDSVSRADAPDRSGPAVAQLLSDAGFDVLERRVVPDGVEPVAQALRELADGFSGLVVTTGGTGFAPRDLTPEATLAVLERQAPGLAEATRRAGQKGALSRAVAGTLGRCLILNLPGSLTGASECLCAVLGLLPHALALLAGENPHPHADHLGRSEREGQPPETGGSSATSSSSLSTAAGAATAPLTQTRQRSSARAKPSP